MWLKLNILLSLVLFSLPLALSAEESPDIADQLETVAQGLENTAQSLTTYQSKISDLSSQIEVLQTQKQAMILAGQTSDEKYRILETKLTDYVNQVESYRDKVTIMQRNYLDLLKLSEELKTKLKSSIALNKVLGVAVGVAIVVIIVESIIISNK